MHFKHNNNPIEVFRVNYSLKAAKKQAKGGTYSYYLDKLNKIFLQLEINLSQNSS